MGKRQARLNTARLWVLNVSFSSQIKPEMNILSFKTRQINVLCSISTLCSSTRIYSKINFTVVSGLLKCNSMRLLSFKICQTQCFFVCYKHCFCLRHGSKWKICCSLQLKWIIMSKFIIHNITLAMLALHTCDMCMWTRWFENNAGVTVNGLFFSSPKTQDTRKTLPS